MSLDSLESHKQFAAKYQLNFSLLSDASGELAGKYGVPTDGGYARRMTFVIDGDGKVARVFPAVKVKGHADEVMAVLQSLQR